MSMAMANLDLIVANGNDNTVSILLNPQGPELDI
jgi:hypothetical protein